MTDKIISYIGGNNRTYRLKDLTGLRFGRLIAKEAVAKDKNRHILWECICDCGNIKTIAGTSLLMGYTMSCGCYKKEVIGKAGLKHGQSNTKLYYVYRGMLSRCYGNDKKYQKRYKGRIFVCERWLEGFQNFYDDMSATYKEGLSLDRINNNGNYDPSNCRWTTAKIQANNKSNNKLLTIGKDSFNVGDWESISGTGKQTIINRIKRGWDVSRAVFGDPINDLAEISEYLIF